MKHVYKPDPHIEDLDRLASVIALAQQNAGPGARVKVNVTINGKIRNIEVTSKENVTRVDTPQSPPTKNLHQY